MSADATPTGINEILITPDEDSQAPSSITESENSSHNGMMQRRSGKQQTNMKPLTTSSDYRTPRPRKTVVALRSTNNQQKAKVVLNLRNLPENHKFVGTYEETEEG